MRGAIWNIRGLNKASRIKCLNDFIMNNKLDFVGIQETKKPDFPSNLLNLIDRRMEWIVLPARGTAGGILVGLKAEVFEVMEWKLYDYCVSVIVKNQLDSMVWRLIVTYGSPYEEKKIEYITELHSVMSNWDGPTLIGGDFNLVRSQNEKSNGVINYGHAELFNEWVNRWGLIENKDSCRYFTWSNNHACPIMTVLDRIFVSTEWDIKYPMASVTLLSRCVSDHSPLLIQFGDKRKIGDQVFKFKKWWLEVEGFDELVAKAWETKCPSSIPVEVCQFKVRLLRKRIK
jgi:exonuclease III